MATPFIVFGDYRILSTNELWVGNWRGGYRKIADISIVNGKLTIIKTYAKIPLVILRKLQEKIDVEKRTM